MPTSVLSLCVLGVFCSAPARGAGAGGPPAAQLRKDLDSPPRPPAWLAATKAPFPDKELTATNRFGLTIWSRLPVLQSDPKKFRQAAATLSQSSK